MRRALVVGSLAWLFFGALGIPPAAAAVTEKITIVHTGIRASSGALFDFRGTLHLAATETARGTTLHANLSNAELIDSVTGERYKVTGAETIRFASQPRQMTVSLTFAVAPSNETQSLRPRGLRPVVMDVTLAIEHSGITEKVTIEHTGLSLPGF